MPSPSLSPYIRIPVEALTENRRNHPILRYKGDGVSFTRRMDIAKIESQGFDSVVQAMEDGSKKNSKKDKSKQNGGVNKNLLAHYGALFKNGMSDIAIKDVPKEDTVLLLNYMYKGKMEIVSKETLVKAIKHGIRFNMGSLIDAILDNYDVRYNSLLIIHDLGKEFGISKYCDAVVDVLKRTVCSPGFSRKLLEAIPCDLMVNILTGNDILAESESEIFQMVLEYLKLSKINGGEAVKVLQKMRYAYLSIEEMKALEETLSGVCDLSKVESLNKVRNVVDMNGCLKIKEEFVKRGGRSHVLMMWLERRYAEENKSVLILNSTHLSKEDKAHTLIKTKLSQPYDPLELFENFETVAIGERIFVNVKDSVYPSKNLIIQSFGVSGEKNDFMRPSKERIPFNFKSEVLNKRLSANGSKLVLSYNMLEKKTKKFKLGYFETVPEVDRTFNEVPLPRDYPNAVYGTMHGANIVVLCSDKLVVIEGSTILDFPVTVMCPEEPSIKSQCVDMIIKNNIIYVYILSYSLSGKYRQKDTIRVVDLSANKLLQSNGGPIGCEVDHISLVVTEEYSERVKRGEARTWCGRGMPTSFKVQMDESLFRFYDMGDKIHFVWQDTFNDNGRIFHFGVLNVNGEPSKMKVSAQVLRKVFYTKSDANGETTLSRQLIGVLPPYIAKDSSATWLEAKLNEFKEGLNQENFKVFEYLRQFV